MTEVASSVVHKVLERRIQDADQPVINYIINILTNEDLDFGVEGKGAFEFLGELLISVDYVNDFSKCRSIWSGYVKAKPTMCSLTVPLRMKDKMGDGEAPNKKPEATDGPLLSKHDRANLERRKNGKKRKHTTFLNSSAFTMLSAFLKTSDSAHVL